MALPRVFSLKPDGASLAATYGYLTDVLTGSDGDEQRVKLRRVPTFGFDFDVVAMDSEAFALQAALDAGPDTEWLMPLWAWPTYLTAAAAAGDTHLHCAVPAGLTPLNGLMPNGPFPRYVVAWRGPTIIGAGQVVDCTGGVQVNLLSPYFVAEEYTTFGVGVTVLPALAGLLSLDAAMTWTGRGAAAAHVSFRANPVGL